MRTAGSPGGPAAPVPSVLSPWRVLADFPHFRRLWTSGAVSDIGTWMQLMTVSTLVASTTGSALRTALVAAATFSPQLVSAPVGGVLADRYDRRHVLLGVLAMQTIGAIVLTIGVATGQGSGVLTLIVLGQGIFGSMANPVTAAMMPDLVPRHGLLAAASLGSVAWNAGRIAGPVIATALITSVGATWCIAANAVSFAVLFAAVATIGRDFPPHASDLNDSVLTRARQGIHALRQTRTALFSYQACLVTQITLGPVIGLIPIYATKVLGGGPKTVSALFVSFGVGSLFGSLSITTLVSWYGRAKTAVGMLMASSILLAALTQARSTWLALVIASALGAVFIGGFVSVNSVVLRDAPPAERGRIASIFSASIGTAYGLGVVGTGALADATSLRVALACGAGVSLLVLLVSLRVARDQWHSIGVADH